MKAKPQKPTHLGFLREQVNLLKGHGWIAHAKDFEAAITALQIIHTWATFDGGRCLDPQHVEKLTRKALKGFITSSPKPTP
jgi:hypothetical protein